MARSEFAKILRVFVSSPSDVVDERTVLDEVVTSINGTDGRSNGFRLELLRWEHDVVPQSGPTPQKVIDVQTPVYDIYIGIMSTRFGTSTGRFGSGTEQEYEAALKNWEMAGSPWIVFYFEDGVTAPRKPREVKQYLEVCEFRERIEEQGLCATYKGVRGSADGFFEKVGDHLRRIVAQIVEPAAEPTPESAQNVSGSPPHSINDYLNRLAEETAHLTMLGMGRSLQVELPIADAYVQLRTTVARSLEERGTERYAEGHAEYHEDVDLSEVFRKAAEFGLRGIVLLGEPGSGKTTGARQLAWRLASRHSLPQDLGLPAGITPVLLRFRNISRAALAHKNGLRTFLEEESYCAEAPDDSQSPGDALWNGKGGGGLVWILDGLDEVVDPAARTEISGWIQRAIRHRGDDWFVVTSRFAGYFCEGVPLGGQFVECHVRPLDDAQIQRFVRDWFGAAYGKLLGHKRQASNRAEDDSQALLGILERQSQHVGHIRELCTNPLLLTILCIVFHEERKLPTGRAELYAHCVRVLLEYWRQDLYESELGTKLEAYDAEAAQAVLARVAWWMHQQQDRTSAPLGELVAEAEGALAQIAPSSGLGRDGQAFLQRMRDEAGILAMESEGRCGSCT